VAESQRVRENAEGSIILELKLGGLEEIERWILSWGKTRPRSRAKGTGNADSR